jgi:hypothetical protein
MWQMMMEIRVEYLVTGIFLVVEWQAGCQHMQRCPHHQQPSRMEWTTTAADDQAV